MLVEPRCQVRLLADIHKDYLYQNITFYLINHNIILRHLATCSADTTVKIWSATNNEFKLAKELKGHQRWVWDCAFSADSAYLVTGKYS